MRRNGGGYLCEVTNESFSLSNMANLKPSFTSNSERTLWYKEQKKQKRLKQKRECARKKSTLYIDQEKRRADQTKQRKDRRKREEERKKYQRDKKAAWRKRKNVSIVRGEKHSDQRHEHAFRYRMERKRAVHRLRTGLPTTPRKRTATLMSYLSNGKSPTVQRLQTSNIIVSPEERNEVYMAKTILGNIKEVVDSTKQKRSKDKRAEMNTVLASISGEDLSEKKVKVKLANRLGVSVKRVTGGQRLRTKVMKSETSCWEYTKRKTRCDAIDDSLKEKIYKFWMSPQISRPTGNKNDVKRHRVGPKSYISHPIYILEKTQTEVYCEFKESNPDIKIGQRSFETIKPFFVKPIRPKDKTTCCCRYHVEFGHAFRKCMQVRSDLHKSKNDVELKTKFPVFEHSSDMIEQTLCEKNDQERWHKKVCLDRECNRCGVRADLFMKEETDQSENSKDVQWERYEYQTLKTKGSLTKRKLVLVKKQTKVGVLFNHFQSLLHKFPSHQFRSEWQTKQAKHIIENLPEGDIVAVHDFSENYRCTEKKEIQSSYFQKKEVSLHVTILHRHAMLEVDGVESTVQEPHIIQEQFFVISPDLQHDHHFTYHAQLLLNNYLKSISYPLRTVHEFTDGCAAQYKSRHCFGNLTIAAKNFDTNIIRNFYETSHAKGPQDAAGGFLKQQADMAVLRGKHIIQSAKDFYDYLNQNYRTPGPSALCKRRVFNYVEEIPRDTARNFRPINAIRSVHQISTTRNNKLITRYLSCYCQDCSNGQYDNCKHIENIGRIKDIELKEEEEQTAESDEECEDEMTPVYELVNVGDIIAVKALDDDYYLLHVTSTCRILTSNCTDEYQTTYKAGTNIIEGKYFQRTGNSVLQYRLLSKHKALVPALSVLYICTEISAGKIIRIPEIVHRSILSNLQ